MKRDTFIIYVWLNVMEYWLKYRGYFIQYTKMKLLNFTSGVEERLEIGVGKESFGDNSRNPRAAYQTWITAFHGMDRSRG